MALWASVVSAAGVGAAGAIFAYRRIRPLYPAKVNCWFCGTDTTVPYGNRNCWDCPSCEQYNGFTEAGDYNKPIPAQSRSDLNFPVPCAKDKFLGHDGVLCDLCQQNQLLKVKQLANFIPINESTFDDEVERYREYLEAAYALCGPCQLRMQQELDRQDAVLYGNLARHQREKALQSAAQAYCVTSLYTASRCHLAVTLLLLLVTLAFAVLHGTAVLADLILKAPLSGMLGKWAVAAVALCGEWQAALLAVGLCACLLSKVAAGKDRLYIGDVLSFCCWLVLFIFHHADVIPGLRPGRNLVVAAAVVCLLNMLSALWCCALDRRLPRNLSSTSVQRRSLPRSPLLNNSGHSETSTTVLSSVSTSRRCRPDLTPPSSRLTPVPPSSSTSLPFMPSSRSSHAPTISPSQVRDMSPEPAQSPRLPGFGLSYRTESCPGGLGAAPRQYTGNSVRFGGTSVFGQGPGYTRSGTLFRRETLSDWTFGYRPVVSEGSPLSFKVTHPTPPRVFSSETPAWNAMSSQPGYEFGASGISHRRPPSAMGLDSGSSVGRTSIFGSEIPPAKLPALTSEEEEEELDLEIEAINLGTTRMPPSESGVFSAVSSGLGQDSTTLRKPGEPRPLITPAKLDLVQFRSTTPHSTVEKKSQASDTPSQVPSALTQDQLSEFNRQTSKNDKVSNGMRRLSLMRHCRTESVSEDEDDEFWESASVHTGTTLGPADSSTRLHGRGLRQRVWQALVSVGVVCHMVLATYLLLLRSPALPWPQ